MKAAEYNSTKQDLIQWISTLNDISLLNFLNSIRMSKNDNDKDWWNELSESEKRNIEIGLEDAKAGRTFSSEEFWKRFNNA